MSTIQDHHELPPDKERINRRAVRIEWITIAFLISAITLMYFSLGSSQAMKTAWVEDILSLIPPIAFLFANRIRRRPPNKAFPYGYHRAVSIAFLVAAIALFTLGALLFMDSLMKLLTFEHPSIGTVELMGRQVWLGWLMIAVLAYTTVPAIVLGRLKLPLARELHDKVLHADAEMNKADWLTAMAAIFGVLGIGLGFFWADAVAAIVISLDILYDGYKNLKGVVWDLMDASPRTVEHEQTDALPARLVTELQKLPYIDALRIRLREEGHVYFGEAWVKFRGNENIAKRSLETAEHARSLDWRMHDLAVMPVEELPDELPEKKSTG